MKKVSKQGNTLCLEAFSVIKYIKETLCTDRMV